MKIHIKYSIIIGVSIGVFNLLYLHFLSSFKMFHFVSYFVYIFLGFGVFLAMRKIKEVKYQNDINYGQMLFNGMTVVAFAALIIAFFNFFYFSFINPDYGTQYYEMNKALIEADKNITPEQLKEVPEIFKRTYSPLNQLSGSFMNFMILGILFTTIISAILRTKDTFTHVLNSEKK